MFDDPALNGFDARLSRDVYLPAGYHLVGSTEIRTRTLRELLDQYLPSDQKIDVLSVDVEGLDLQVLRSNDWIRYRPLVILAELLPVSAGRSSAETTVEYLAGKDYEIIARTPNTGFFSVRGQSLPQLTRPD
jgi:hypothetical protein